MGALCGHSVGEGSLEDHEWSVLLQPFPPRHDASPWWLRLPTATARARGARRAVPSAEIPPGTPHPPARPCLPAIRRDIAASRGRTSGFDLLSSLARVASIRHGLDSLMTSLYGTGTPRQLYSTPGYYLCSTLQADQIRHRPGLDPDKGPLAYQSPARLSSLLSSSPVLLLRGHRTGFRPGGRHTTLSKPRRPGLSGRKLPRELCTSAVVPTRG